jgi:prepilin-type N-terminal cleavage/methylation domain-containing protein
MRYFRTSRSVRRRSRGFTLIETALTVSIVGVGIVAMCQLLAAGTSANVDATELTTGTAIAKNIREFSLKLAFKEPTAGATGWGLNSGESWNNPATLDDVNDLNGATFQPPIDSTGAKMTTFGTWKQTVTVVSVDPNRLTLTTTNGSTSADRVTVTVYHNNAKVCDLTWYAFDGSVR